MATRVISHKHAYVYVVDSIGVSNTIAGGGRDLLVTGEAAMDRTAVADAAQGRVYG
jgi:hypothetical protein